VIPRPAKGGFNSASRTFLIALLRECGFKDAFAVERLDDREDYGEQRFVIIGRAKGDVVLFVAYTEREDRIRIISARRATQLEKQDYFRQNA